MSEPIQSLVLTVLKLRPDKSVELQWTSSAGRGYVLQASSDLDHWSELFQTPGKDEVASYLDFKAPTFRQRFWRLLEFGAPANDAFSNSVPLAGADVHSTSFNFNATREPGEPIHAWSAGGSASVWWHWIAPITGGVSVNTIGTYVETSLAVYEGATVTNLTVVAKHRRASKLISFQAREGGTYRIAVESTTGHPGVIRLALSASARAPAAAPESIDRVSVFLDEQSNPLVPLRMLNLSVTGWNEQPLSTEPPLRSGEVWRYDAEGARASLQLIGERNGQPRTLEFAFDFESAVSGRYEWTLDGRSAGYGRFANFRNLAGDFAPASLAEKVMELTRLYTSTGPVGQTHFYSFTADGSFHDADNDEQASGKYVYEANQAEAELQLNYEGAADFRGDTHALHLQFIDALGGTFSSTYLKNDQTVIVIDGTFRVHY
ncbi:MAG: hypothetical protein AB1813_06235 [Verrucomicrobiota bacterium]